MCEFWQSQSFYTSPGNARQAVETAEDIFYGMVTGGAMLVGADAVADVVDTGACLTDGDVGCAVVSGAALMIPILPAKALRNVPGAGWVADKIGDGAAWLGNKADNLFSRGVRNCFNSFTAATLVMTENGLIPIGELKIGDKVLAYNEMTGALEYRPITKVWVHDDPILIRLVIEGEVIWTTPEHPFYLAQGEWVNAADLQVGNEIRNANWLIGTVDSVTVVYQTQTMYNLTVAIAHTFFVGDGQWLVHNTNKCEKVINSNLVHAADRAIERAGFDNIQEARDALRAFGANIEANGLPSTAIPDPAHSDRIIVPNFGDGGAIVYQKTKNGKLRLKTVLIWIDPENI